MSLTTKIIIIAIVIHLLIGFGWLIYKLSPSKKKEETNKKEETK